ncbi:carotenoid oxygenase family protein [Steroidobacter sp.]|uniref:carotenoid oxygenase family protein n=1 Tax=Steroidobacter sp. TaxID=1978227 RepID=UPI001A3A35F1|nr:carotenoid oxygenase family protein [Steroidobacter sp.]MBL8272025.1 carotenoid oxygenase family protein [Steroidobacter sp.]
MSAAISPTRSIETLAPFRRSSEHPAAVPTKISGNIPDWLRGEVIRTCPAVFETNGWRAQHWFDGLGMIYAFRIGDSVVDFRSRLLDSEVARDAWHGKANLGSFGTPTVRPLLQRIFEPVARISDNTNVNIVKMGQELVAMTEGDRQNIIDEETLAAVRFVDYEKGALGGTIMSAHPHFDFERGKVMNVATGFGVSGVVSIYEHSPAARQRDIIGSWRTKRVPYIHTFGVTPKHAILVAHPFAVSPVKMLWSSKGYIDHFDWQPEQGTRLVVIDRSNGQIREHLTDPFFVFHTVNAFERADATVLDLLAYPNENIMASLRTDRMVAELPDLRPSLIRLVMRPGVERVTVEKLSDVGFEFPSTNYKRVNGQAYRFAYGASDGYQAGGAYDSAIVKADLETGKSTAFGDGDHIFGEPLFVSRPGGDAEDDGVLLTVGAAQNAETSILAVIDAKSMALIASAEVQSSIPLGFHGSFVRKEG